MLYYDLVKDDTFIPSHQLTDLLEVQTCIIHEYSFSFNASFQGSFVASSHPESNPEINKSCLVR